MKYSSFFCIILFLIFSSNSFNAQNNDNQAALYNIGLGSFFGGVGAVINKKPNEKLTKVFIKGLWQGSLGGYINFQSKKLTYNFSKSGDFKHAWGSKILNALGNSIVHNAASNKDFWEKGYINFGFNRLEFSIKNKFKVQYKIMPLALYGAIINFSQGKFDFKNSIKTGHFIFKTNEIGSSFETFEKRGKANYNSILILDNFILKETEFKVLAHEIIHIYQYNDFSNINPVFSKPKKLYLNNENTLVKFYRKWFYSDFNGLLLNELYGFENQNIKKYNDNYFEKEADYYSFKSN